LDLRAFTAQMAERGYQRYSHQSSSISIRDKISPKFKKRKSCSNISTMPASHSLETVFVRFNPFLMGDIFTGYLGTCVTPTVVQLGFAKPLLNAALSQRPQRTHLSGHALAGVPEG
jgi:hypothetical protein